VSYYVLQEFATLMGSAYMPRTPSIVFILILGFLAVYSSYGGLEVICRVNSLIIIAPLFLLILIALLSLKDISLSRFMPILENGWGPVFLGVIPPGDGFAKPPSSWSSIPT